MKLQASVVNLCQLISLSVLKKQTLMLLEIAYPYQKSTPKTYSIAICDFPVPASPYICVTIPLCNPPDINQSSYLLELLMKTLSDFSFSNKLYYFPQSLFWLKLSKFIIMIYICQRYFTSTHKNYYKSNQSAVLISLGFYLEKLLQSLVFFENFLLFFLTFLYCQLILFHNFLYLFYHICVFISLVLLGS